MAKLNGIYKCNICGNIVSVLVAKEPNVVCCGQEMELLKEKTEEEGNEKHVPVVEKTDSGLKVKVGSVEHPMEEEHFIVFIQVFVDDKLVVGKRLYPGDKPELELLPKYEGAKITARELCNVHGLWGN